MIMLAVMVTVGGCQSSKGFCEDIAGIATWSADKLEGLAEKAAERDADLAAKRLAERQAILDARIRMANANEVR
jgi:hypothetical protein